MKVTHVFFVNMFKDGYTLTGPDELSDSLREILESQVYPIKKDSVSPSVAYKISCLAPKSFLISIVTWWPAIADERGRKGILFIHHVHCESKLGMTAYDVSQIAIALFRGYTELQSPITEILSSVAKRPSDSSWFSDLITLSSARFSQVSVDSIVNNFRVWNGRTHPNKINIYADFPFQDTAVIPCLVAYIFNGIPGETAAGGDLDVSELSAYNIISCKSNTEIFRGAKLSDVINSYPIKARKVRVKTSKNTENNSGNLKPDVINSKGIFARLFSNINRKKIDTDQERRILLDRLRRSSIIIKNLEIARRKDKERLYTFLSHQKAYATDLENFIINTYGKIE